MSDALDTLLEQAEAERNVALLAFNQCRARRDAAREQAVQLEDYRRQHDTRWRAQFQRHGAGVDIVRCHQQFGSRLNDAIAQQAQAVAACEAALARANDTLAAHELRVASVRKLIERRAAQRKHADDRREQKAADETAMRIARARRDAMRTTTS